MFYRSSRVKVFYFRCHDVPDCNSSATVVPSFLGETKSISLEGVGD